MKKKALALLLAGAMAMSLAACGSSETADTSAAETPAATEETDAAESTEAAETTGDAAAADADYALEKGDYVIGLSNSFYGNTWRKQMVESFTEAAEEAKKAGYIADFEIQNGDGTVNTQIAQINSFILEGVDAICINAASSTALNDVIQQAMKQGIKITLLFGVIYTLLLVLILWTMTG